MPIRYPAIRAWLRGLNAIRSIETARVHHVARRRGGGVAGRGKGATGGSVGDRAHPNLARATAYYRRWPTSRPCLLAFRFTAATVLLIDLAIVVTGVFLRKWLFNSRKSSFVHLRTGRPSDRRSVMAFRFTAATVRFIDFAIVVAGRLL